MIQANELRIGNIIMQKGDVSNIGHIQNNFYGVFINGVGPLGWHEFKPIPLTPEILEKCGFEIFTHHMGGLSARICIMKSANRYLNIIGIMPQHTFKLSMVSEGENNHVPLTSTKYIHQLQNLYRALTGEELEVNL